MISKLSVEINGSADQQTNIYLAKVLSDLVKIGLLDMKNGSITLHIDQTGVVKKIERKEQVFV
jgi:hypothetical protein